jgi:hypothetical protein
MHATSLPPAGKGVLLEHTSDGEYVRTKVVEPTAIRLVDEGVYTGYSVGIARPRIIRDARARGGRIVDGKIVELSLVDRPALPTAKFAVLKAAGATLIYVGDTAEALTLDPSTFAKAVVADLRKNAAEGSVDREDEQGPVSAEVEKADQTACPECGGSGTIGDDGAKCGKCEGTGKCATKAAEPPEDEPAKEEAAEEPVEKKADPEEAPAAAAPAPEVHVSFHTDDETGDDPDDGDDAEKRAKAPPFVKQPAADDAAPSDDGAAPAGPDQEAVVAPVDHEVVGEKKPPKVKPTKAEKKAKKKAEKNAEKVAKVAVAEAAKVATAAAAGFANPDSPTVPWTIKRAHDAVCAAYGIEDLGEFYPTIAKSGIASAFGMPLQTSLYGMLAGEIAADGGTATKAEDIMALAYAFEEVRSIAKADNEDLLAARAALHEAFKSESLTPTKLVAPKPAETITPGEYKRPYLSAGHQTEPGSATEPRIPGTVHTITADQYSRGPLTDGHARTLTQKLSDLHDALASWQPSICRMDANGRNDVDRQPASSFVRPPFIPSIDPKVTAVPSRVTLPATSKAPGEKVATIGAADTITSDANAIEPILADYVAPYMTKIAQLEAQVAELQAAPDPTRSALRGVTGEGVSKVAQAEKVAGIEAQREAARSKKRTEKVAYLQELASSPHPEVRNHAQERLTRMGIEP